MRAYIARRFLYMMLMMAMASVVSFAVITLPPGDYMTSYIMRLKAQGQDVGLEEELALRRQYGLDQPLPVQYFKWVSRFIKGDMGRSFEYNRPVVEVLMPRIGMTMIVSIAALQSPCFPVGLVWAA